MPRVYLCRYQLSHLIGKRDEISIGIFIVCSRKFKCSLKHADKSFYRAANAVFSKIGRVASKEVTLQLIKSKCIPVLLYGLEA